MENYKSVKCMICEKRFSQLNSHIIRTHKITVKKYKDIYPNSLLVCKEITDKISNKNKGKQRSQEHKDNLKKSIQRGFNNGRIAHNKGITGVIKASEETKQKMKEARARSTYTHSEETLKKISDGNKKPKPLTPEGKRKRKESYEKRMNTFYGPYPKRTHTDETKMTLSEIARNRTPEQVAEKVRLMNEARRGQKESLEVRLKRSQIRIEYMANNPDKIPRRMFDTVPELEFEEELRSRNIPYKKQYHTKKPHFLFDFIINDTILVEIDGPYHYNPELYSTLEEYEYKKNIDLLKNDAADAFGLFLFRIKVGQNLPCNWLEILEDQGFYLERYQDYKKGLEDENFKNNIIELYKKLFSNKNNNSNNSEHEDIDPII